MFGLAAQIRRASISIAANIAEGSDRRSDAEFARFVSMAGGSAAELTSHLILAHDLGLLSPDDLTATLSAVEDLRRQLNALHARLKPDRAAS